MRHAARYVALVSLALVALATPPPAAGVPLTKAQQKCVDALNKALVKVVGAQAKEIEACVKLRAKGKGGNVDACVTADAKRKVEKAADKTAKDAGKRCGDPPPPYGATDAATVNVAGEQAARDLARDLFGPALNTAILTQAFDKNGSKCQLALAAAVKKCRDTKLKEFLKCKKTGLKKGTIDSSAGLEACVGADPKGKIAKACDEPVKGDAIRKALARKCVAKGADLAAAAPPCGVTADVEATHACLEPAIECRVCRALDLADGLGRDCDTFDDGLANDSCATPGPLAHRVFLPLVVSGAPFGGPQSSVLAQPQQEPDDFTTDVRVQNAGTADATVVVTYYQQDGSVAADGILALPAGAKYDFNPGFNDGSNLGAPFAGSAVVSSDREIVALVRPDGFFADFSAFGTAAYNGLREDAAGSTLFFPNVTCDYFGRTTTFYVQNTSATSAASCTVAYTAAAAGQSQTEPRLVPPGGVAVFDQETDLTPGRGCESLGGLDDMFAGSALVSCSGAGVVGTVVERNSASETLLAWNGLSQGSTSVSLPLIRANSAGFSTALQVQNLGGGSTDVTVTFSPNTVSGGNPASAETVTLPVGGSAAFVQQGVSGPNDWDAIGGYVGGATITQTGSAELVALVTQQQTSGSIGAGYAGFDPGQAGDTLVLPLVNANVFGFSEISIQAVEADTEVTITYSANAGTPPTPTPNPDVLSLTGAGDARTIVLDGVSGANDWDAFGPYVGSATVTSDDPGKPIVAVVTRKILPGFGDSGFAYEGFRVE